MSYVSLAGPVEDVAATVARLAAAYPTFRAQFMFRAPLHGVSTTTVQTNLQHLDSGMEKLRRGDYSTLPQFQVAVREIARLIEGDTDSAWVRWRESFLSALDELPGRLRAAGQVAGEVSAQFAKGAGVYPLLVAVGVGVYLAWKLR